MACSRRKVTAVADTVITGTPTPAARADGMALLTAVGDGRSPPADWSAARRYEAVAVAGNAARQWLTEFAGDCLGAPASGAILAGLSLYANSSSSGPESLPGVILAARAIRGEDIADELSQGDIKNVGAGMIGLALAMATLLADDRRVSRATVFAAYVAEETVPPKEETT